MPGMIRPTGSKNAVDMAEESAVTGKPGTLKTQVYKDEAFVVKRGGPSPGTPGLGTNQDKYRNLSPEARKRFGPGLVTPTK